MEKLLQAKDGVSAEITEDYVRQRRNMADKACEAGKPGRFPGLFSIELPRWGFLSHTSQERHFFLKQRQHV